MGIYSQNTYSFYYHRLRKLEVQSLNPSRSIVKLRFFLADIARLSNFVQSNKDEEPISVNLIEQGSLSVLLNIMQTHR